MKKYKDLQYDRVLGLMDSEVFYGDRGNGSFKGRAYPFVLQNASNNLFLPFAEQITSYMNHYQAFWNGTLTTHTLSSQVACLNHLFPIRQDKQAVLAVARAIEPSIADVLLIESDDFMPAYIQFEAVSDKDYLNEGKPNRGANCTSVDALILGQRQNGDKLLLPIEWKYVECYDNKRVYSEKIIRNGVVSVNKRGLTAGEERQRRYFGLIDRSEQLKPIAKQISDYEPFYQLMRQTLWAEQMVNNKVLEAVDFIHVHVIPSQNSELLHKKYSVSLEPMEQTWRQCLADQAKYRIIEPQALLSNIDSTKNGELISYLQKRYWI